MGIKNKLSLVIIVLFFSVLTPLYSFSAPVDPGCDPLDPSCPIDGGVTVLLAAGIALGAKRMKRKD